MTQGKVISIISNLIMIKADGPVGQNEICYIHHQGKKLMSEVIRVVGNTASAQVYESTRGIKVGSQVEFTGHMLELTLGPGILSKNYDGLQSDLEKMEGLYLERGEYTFALDEEEVFTFTPLVQEGDEVTGADWLGNVKENWIDHKIMVPFKFQKNGRVKWIAEEGNFTIRDTIAIITDEDGEEMEVNMIQKWPIKVAVTNYNNKPRPGVILQTGIRVMDTFNPMTEGGTGFIPGPFGSGKTVLQHAIAKNADADIIIMTACGERANEVVEIFTEFPELEDPRTGRKLQERTTIVCNTSNMPVAVAVDDHEFVLPGRPPVVEHVGDQELLERRRRRQDGRKEDGSLDRRERHVAEPSQKARTVHLRRVVQRLGHVL